MSRDSGDLGDSHYLGHQRLESFSDTFYGHPAVRLRERLPTALAYSFHLDYISCLLTVVSTVLVGRRMWQGWIVSAINSVIVCLIGMQTGQWGFVPANVFCLAIYAYNLRAWRAPGMAESPSDRMSATLNHQNALNHRTAIFDRARLHGFRAGDERLTSNRIRQGRVPDRRESRPSL